MSGLRASFTALNLMEKENTSGETTSVSHAGQVLSSSGFSIVSPTPAVIIITRKSISSLSRITLTATFLYSALNARTVQPFLLHAPQSLLLPCFVLSVMVHLPWVITGDNKRHLLGLWAV